MIKIAISLAVIFSIGAARAETVSLDQQAKCAAQGEKVFLEMGLSHQSDVYQSHVNSALNKCFVSIEAGVGSPISRWLLDAYEQRLYASYRWVSKPNKKYWEVPPQTCELIPSFKEKRNCTSRGV
jgi:hypothetical protein